MIYGQKFMRRLVLFGGASVFGGGLLGLGLVLTSLQHSYNQIQIDDTQTIKTNPFPIGVDPKRATVTEQSILEQTDAEQVSVIDHSLNYLASQLQTNHWYQRLASPISRIIIVWPGERTEEAAQNIAGVMRWDSNQTQQFIDLMQDNKYSFEQGFVLPGQYITHRNATPDDIANLIQTRYQTAVLDRYTADIETAIPLSEALIIASLIEREASDFENMREVSGVIWNRLFIDMPLQLDASLQYVKANQPTELDWWPVVRPKDKYLDSPYNTYQHNGLPPSPIANPSVEAIIAALNPRATDCLYYFHSASREYYCNATYEEHVEELRRVYGRGN